MSTMQNKTFLAETNPLAFSKQAQRIHAKASVVDDQTDLPEQIRIGELSLDQTDLQQNMQSERLTYRFPSFASAADFTGLASAKQYLD